MNEMTWGLQRDVTPRFGVRLVQESNRLHYLSDRASITGKFSDVECLRLDEAFPHFVRQMELMLTTGDLNPRHTHCVTLYHNGFTCEADTLGSCGYVYIAIYPTQR
ncbi:type IV toxin-antitoxin system YeeU family antitoxin [Enterobacter roggenkampii]|uniref:type IV toxin-antitoxin system YeeU family antitoxin n=1 Tax=Enterobacteriaceae TaxID=543 RepID=UPI0002FA15BB|nr:MULTISPECIES: type IV toxin-antitoxin system YeeU family antitoxin [Enterobacteriaceae]EFL5748054.1 type IV toxin-antitoxin system YeeU family antitoxin [Escherichia coli P12b]MDT0178260.1 type IV toxin-antitoxin system YeeU family antitoxin [Enterobacter sp. BRE11]EFB5406907.1 type IV toxin-antitoxin system YeeU family antitoxin [Escherichia coli]EFH4339142.1 type IV toxin-antitoxin system YeeU family antitoxin [Escherichia coli]EFJ7440280.1 type IV toxin-antitoxin system YeeU family antit